VVFGPQPVGLVFSQAGGTINRPEGVPFGDYCEANQKTLRGLASGEYCFWRSAAQAGPQPEGA
jgi:hypothetical protein